VGGDPVDRVDPAGMEGPDGPDFPPQDDYEYSGEGGAQIPAAVGLDKTGALQFGIDAGYPAWYTDNPVLDPTIDTALFSLPWDPSSIAAGEPGEGSGRVSCRWGVGQDIWSRTDAGNEPSWSTVRARYWKNAAAQAGSADQWDAENLARMQRGSAPQRANPLAPGGLESMELSHEPIPAREGGQGLTERWPCEHAAVDPYRFPGYC
jgi:hypothetical protein